jgi:hypothetical protein
MMRRDFVAGLMIASAMRHAVAQQPTKTKRIALVASSTMVSDMRADKNWGRTAGELGSTATTPPIECPAGRGEKAAHASFVVVVSCCIGHLR